MVQVTNHVDALLPCPFCGSKADPEQGFHGLIVIGCGGYCSVYPQTQPFDTYDEASAAWNRRAPVKCVHDLAKEYNESVTPIFGQQITGDDNEQ